MLEIMDSSGTEINALTNTRQVSAKYYNLTNAGIDGAVDTFDSDSIWIENEGYAKWLTETLEKTRTNQITRTLSILGMTQTATVKGSGNWVDKDGNAVAPAYTVLISNNDIKWLKTNILENDAYTPLVADESKYDAILNYMDGKIFRNNANVGNIHTDDGTNTGKIVSVFDYAGVSK